jgi:hypothetical protein
MARADAKVVDPGLMTIPGGRELGKTLEEASSKTLDWWRENAKRPELREACAAELARRARGGLPRGVTKVRFFPYVPGRSSGNLMWARPYHPMYGGKLPPTHPCANNPKPMSFGISDQPPSEDALGKFRARGYWASCFPEGDGILFQHEPKTDEEVIRDVVECFGWEVEVKRA